MAITYQGLQTIATHIKNDIKKVIINGIEIMPEDYIFEQVEENVYKLDVRLPRQISRVTSLILADAAGVNIAEYLLNVAIPDDAIFRYKLYVDNHFDISSSAEVDARLRRIEHRFNDTDWLEEVAVYEECEET